MVGHWESCECRKCDRKRIEDLREENERLLAALRQIIECDRKRIEDLRAEIERLRQALTKVASLYSIDDFPWIASDVRDIVRKALEGGDDE